MCGAAGAVWPLGEPVGAGCWTGSMDGGILFRDVAENTKRTMETNVAKARKIALKQSALMIGLD